jgi:uncharacterized protein YjbI with pentapeptide repeats
MAVFLPNGIGDYSTGDSLAYARPLQASGNIWYVSATTGTDAVSPAGLNASKPLATLGQAVTNAADHDIIVLVSHVETFTSALTINKALTIIGSASSAGIPASALSRIGGAAANLLTITAAGVQLRNIRFPETDTSAVATARIAVSGARFRMVNCLVLSGVRDTGPALLLSAGADQAEIRNCTFQAYSLTTGPESAIKSGAALTQLRIYNTSISAQNTSWSNYYAVDISAAAVTRAEVEGLGLLYGSDMKLHASSTGWVHVETATGGARVDW